MNRKSPIRVLVTGATGYVGGRLVKRLLGQGFTVRCLVRDWQRGQRMEWSGRVTIAEGDVLRPQSLTTAMHDIDVAYYLIHSMAGGPGFDARDHQAAQNFSRAAVKAGVKQIIYLGGLGDPQANLSPHLKSRHETGQALRIAGVPVTEFRAGVIVGSGSLSFELVRYLTERVPVMICPRWVYTKTQPISIADVLSYLMAGIRPDEPYDRIIEIGANVVSYGDMMRQYAELRGLKRWLLPVPVLTPRLSSYWVHLVTPVTGLIARPLIEGLKNEATCLNDDARRLFPEIHPKSYREAVIGAFKQPARESTWFDAVGPESKEPSPTVVDREGVFVDRRSLVTSCSQVDVFRQICGLGGDNGWPFMNWAWALRGLVDRLVGGVGLRRGRRDQLNLRVGDALDFWRVEHLVEPKSIRLKAEMKLPGKAWLEYRLIPENGGTRVEQWAYFAPKGFMGWVYWVMLYPIHAVMFTGTISSLIRQAEALPTNLAEGNCP